MGHDLPPQVVDLLLPHLIPFLQSAESPGTPVAPATSA
jgi:hypothetical protein